MYTATEDAILREGTSRSAETLESPGLIALAALGYNGELHIKATTNGVCEFNNIQPWTSSVAYLEGLPSIGNDMPQTVNIGRRLISCISPATNR